MSGAVCAMVAPLRKPAVRMRGVQRRLANATPDAKPGAGTLALAGVLRDGGSDAEH
jgi:hypothetical protein